MCVPVPQKLIKASPSSLLKVNGMTFALNDNLILFATYTSSTQPIRPPLWGSPLIASYQRAPGDLGALPSFASTSSAKEKTLVLWPAGWKEPSKSAVLSSQLFSPSGYYQSCLFVRKTTGTQVSKPAFLHPFCLFLTSSPPLPQQFEKNPRSLPECSPVTLWSMSTPDFRSSALS